MKELVVISGKGGTGKTSITAALAYLSKNTVIADCDVDAADLHLVINNQLKMSEDFYSGSIPVPDKNLCTRCGKCVELCRFGAISEDIIIDGLSCEGCGVCAHFCPEQAIKMEEKISGQVLISRSELGPFVHGRLGIAESNSGKMVARVRKLAKNIALEEGRDLILVDGSPGIGCPVIASISGASLVLAVTEPTVSGIHDMKRVVELTEHFRIKTVICINKCDINYNNVREIKNYCENKAIDILGYIPYDLEFTKAQINAKSIVEHSDNAAAKEIRKLWERLSEALQQN